MSGNNIACAQDTVANDTTVYNVAEKMPAYPGGESKFYKLLSERLNSDCFKKEEMIHSKLYVDFIVTKTGEVHDIKATYNRVQNECLTRQMIEIFSKSEKWMAGEHKGQKVNVRMKVPVIVHFK